MVYAGRVFVWTVGFGRHITACTSTFQEMQPGFGCGGKNTPTSRSDCVVTETDGMSTDLLEKIVMKIKTFIMKLK